MLNNAINEFFVRTTHSNQASLYYITFTCFSWLPLFQLSNAYDLVYMWLNYLQTEKNIKTTAYVNAGSRALHKALDEDPAET